MFVVRRTTWNDVVIGELPSKCNVVLHAFTVNELNTRVLSYLPTWKWKPDQSIFGGYWVDRTLVGDREGESYIIDTANKEDEDLIQAAYDWHSGMNSPLYSFASTGCVFGENHRSGLLKEIAICMHHASDEDKVILSSLDKQIRERNVLVVGRL